jgi:hypothetical protein
LAKLFFGCCCPLFPIDGALFRFIEELACVIPVEERPPAPKPEKGYELLYPCMVVVDCDVYNSIFDML